MARCHDADPAHPRIHHVGFIGEEEKVAALRQCRLLVIPSPYESLSVIVLRYKRPELDRPYRVPFSIGRMPVLPLVGLASVAFMTANLEADALIVGARRSR